MRSSAGTVREYLAELPEDRREAVSAVRDVTNANLPEGYVESMGSGMIGWRIPIYLMGLYASGPEERWFRGEYARRAMKPDTGKSCVRFTRLEHVPLDLIGDVIAKITPEQYIERYENSRAHTKSGR